MLAFVVPKRFVLFLILQVASCAFGQSRSMTFDAWRSVHGSTAGLDSAYRSAVNVDSTKAVFGGRTEEFINAYQLFLREFGTFLEERGFVWKEGTRCYNRIYFSKEGRVDVFLYSFKQGVLEPAAEERFDALLNEFLRDHSLPMKADVPFSQCSPVIYQGWVKEP